MKRMTPALVVLIFALGIALPTAVVEASKAPGGSKGGRTKSVHVKEHTTKNGTHVPPHDRKAPEKRREARAKKPRPAPAVRYRGVARDERGRIQRSDTARHAFARQTGYPNGRPGYVIDHIRPLACGGVDAPSNMQWQTVAAAKAKDKTERHGCR